MIEENLKIAKLGFRVQVHSAFWPPWQKLGSNRLKFLPWKKLGLVSKWDWVKKQRNGKEKSIPRSFEAVQMKLIWIEIQIFTLPIIYLKIMNNGAIKLRKYHAEKFPKNLHNLLAFFRRTLYWASFSINYGYPIFEERWTWDLNKFET